MAEVTLDWFGDKYTKQVNTATIKALTRSINLVDASAKLNTPVDTGLLRSSNVKAVFPNKLIATETNNTEYANAIEFGTKHQKDQPFMRPALFDNLDNINKIFIEEEKKAIDN